MAPLPSKRDALPSQRTIHSLLLTYTLTVVEAGKHTIKLPLLNKYVCMLCISILSGAIMHAVELWMPCMHMR